MKKLNLKMAGITIPMKKKIAVLLIYAGFSNVHAQNYTFDNIVANPNQVLKTIEWPTSPWGNGFGHILYNADFGGKTYLRVGARHNASGYSDVLSITSDGKMGLGTSTPTVGFTVLGSENNTSIGMNTQAAIRICNWYTANYGRKAELQFGLNDDQATNLGVIAGEYSTGGGATGIGGDLVFGTKPTGSNIVERMRLTNDGSLLIKQWDGVTINFKVDQFGFVECRQLTVHTAQIPADYVFEKNYKLMPLSDLGSFIAKNKHLPGFKSADFYVKNGINTTEFMITEQEKIEELTLYILELEKRISLIEKQK